MQIPNINKYSPHWKQNTLLPTQFISLITMIYDPSGSKINHNWIELELSKSRLQKKTDIKGHYILLQPASLFLHPI